MNDAGDEQLVMRKRAATIIDVAEAAGVAIGTVSRHLNGLPIRASNLRQIERAIADLGYRRNSTAVAMKTARTRIVGFMVPGLSEFHAGMFELLSRNMRASGRAVLTFCHDHQPNAVREGLDFFAHHRVDALVLDGADTAREDLTRFVEEGVVLALYDNDITGLPADRIFVDNRKASDDIVSHLIGLGHTRIATIHGSLSNSVAHERLQGYRDAMERHGLAIDDDLVIDGYWKEPGGYAAIKSLMSLPTTPTAVFSANYTMTLGVLGFLHEAGIVLPRDMSLASFDNVPALRLHIPGITTIGQPTTHIAELLTQIIDARLANPSATKPTNIELECELIVRGSTGRPH